MLECPEDAKEEQLLAVEEEARKIELPGGNHKYERFQSQLLFKVRGYVCRLDKLEQLQLEARHVSCHLLEPIFSSFSGALRAMSGRASNVSIKIQLGPIHFANKGNPDHFQVICSLME